MGELGNLGIIISAGYDASNDYQPDIERKNFSRGTGDSLVAMDQYQVKKSNKQIDTNLLTTVGWDIDNFNYLYPIQPVSYTHLTLPTM